MKSTGTKILFAALVLTLAACSGGGGGGGGGSNSGDVANDSPTITNPPTAAKGTSEDMDDLAAAIGGNTNSVVSNLFNIFDTTPVKTMGKFKAKGGEPDPCISIVGDETDGDGDGFAASYRLTSTNCTYEGEDAQVGMTETYSDDLVIRDVDDNDEYSDASLTLKGVSSWKNSSNVEVASGYTVSSLSFLGNSGLLKMNFKTGGYDNRTEPAQPQGYMAFWLNAQFSESPLLAVSATLSGFVQFYVQNVGLVTATVTSTQYTLNEMSECLENGTLSFKYADNSDVLVSPLEKNICLGAFASY